jgi:RNA 3'-terminal phosphate cyclase (ATP)
LRQGVVEIDGSRGEGGGQILRTSLALAAITRRPLRVTSIRARRSKPGLQAQHVACVEAAARICGAGVGGAKIGSGVIDFAPGALRGGDFEWHIGTAGSAGLVLQTVLVPLLMAPARSRIEIVGGTHNPMAPPFDFLDRVYLPALRRMGARVTLALTRHGFYPRGGGRIVCEIEPGPLAGVAFDEATPVRRRLARALVARLPREIGEREIAVVMAQLGWRSDECGVVEVESAGPGNALILEVERDGVAEVVTAMGERGVPAERVAAAGAKEMAAYLASGVPVGAHLADQLMLPMAVARAGRFRTVPLTPHATTNLETIARFLDTPVKVTAAPAGTTVRFGE